MACGRRLGILFNIYDECFQMNFCTVYFRVIGQVSVKRGRLSASQRGRLVVHNALLYGVDCG